MTDDPQATTQETMAQEIVREDGMMDACEIVEDKFKTGNCMYRAVHKPTGSLIGLCLSRSAAERLIKAGAMFMDWNTLTANEAKAIKGGPDLLEYFAKGYGVEPIWPDDRAIRPLWCTADDLAMLSESRP